jgi:hypothetical protein
MHRILQDAANDAARDHAYRNRSGDLTAQTNANVVSNSEDETVVDLVADTPYASFVNARGLMTIDQHAELAEGLIELEFEVGGDA